jgi:hypothetical protein
VDFKAEGGFFLTAVSMMQTAASASIGVMLCSQDRCWVPNAVQVTVLLQAGPNWNVNAASARHALLNRQER